MNSYDSYGWLSDTAIADRVTPLVPPEHGAKTVGQPYPNFTGVAWVMVPYSIPVEATPIEPPGPRILTKLEYMNRFTDAELAGIYTAAKTTVQVEIWLDKFKLASEINLDDPYTVGGLQAMEAAGLIDTGRSMEILA